MPSKVPAVFQAGLEAIVRNGIVFRPPFSNAFLIRVWNTRKCTVSHVQHAFPHSKHRISLTGTAQNETTGRLALHCIAQLPIHIYTGLVRLRRYRYRYCYRYIPLHPIFILYSFTPAVVFVFVLTVQFPIRRQQYCERLKIETTRSRKAKQTEPKRFVESILCQQVKDT